MPDVNLRALEAAFETDAISLNETTGRFQVNGSSLMTIEDLTPELRAVYDREEARASATYPTLDVARAAMVAWIDQLMTAITGPVPSYERASWPSKAEAARAYQAGTARPDQIAMIEGEAATSPRTPAEVAAVIVLRADQYEAIVSRSAGLRVSLDEALEAATDPAQYETILNTGKSQALALAESLGIDTEGLSNV